MADVERIISIAERLKSRREELGISQSQAARELDVARTAYRLWELEAAKPAPDRWRLIASWLGVSVTTMLLAEDLVTEEEATMGELVAADFGRSGRDWDSVGASQSRGFFTQARSLIDDGRQNGDITDEHAAALTVVLDRIEKDASTLETMPWPTAELRRMLPPNPQAPKIARDALIFTASGIPEEHLQTARLLVTELVTNSVRHGPQGSGATIELHIQVDRDQLRIDVTDSSATPALPKPPSDQGGYGLALVASLASRWGAGINDGQNVTWFALDLPQPGLSTP